MKIRSRTPAGRYVLRASEPIVSVGYRLDFGEPSLTVRIEGGGLVPNARYAFEVVMDKVDLDSLTAARELFKKEFKE